MVLVDDLTKALFFLLLVVLQGPDSLVSAFLAEEDLHYTGCLVNVQVLQINLLLLLKLERSRALNVL